MAKKSTSSLSASGGRILDSGVAFGKIKNAAGAVFSLFIGGLLFLFGIYYAFFKEDKPTVEIQGEAVADSDTKTSMDSEGNVKFTALTEVKWTVDGKEYTKTVAGSTAHKKGGLVKLEYIVGQPADAVICCRTKNSTWGYSMLGLGTMFLLAGSVMWYLRNNEFLAAANAINTFR